MKPSDEPRGAPRREAGGPKDAALRDQHKWSYCVGAVLLVAFLLVAFGRNRFTRSDPRGTLLVSEALLLHYTIRLDDYPANRLEGQYQFRLKNGHYYYFYPIGTSIASLPFVVLARGFGFDIRESEPEIQMVIAAFTCVLMLAAMIAIARLFVDRWNALLLASLFWFGTSLASTAATALWSHNFAILFGFVALYCAIGAVKHDLPPSWPVIGLSLFGAYLCRPTMALLAPMLLPFMFRHGKEAAVKAGLLWLACLGGYLAFNMHEYGQILPDYYLPGWLTGEHFSLGLYANLLSPSRGLLVFSPFLPVAWANWSRSRQGWGLDLSWLLMGLVWPVVHLVVISRNPFWWGGYSFGARLMMDVLPGLFLVTAYCWPTTTSGRASKLFTIGLAVAAAFSIFVNSGQGLFNRWTATWNSTPSIDIYPEYVFDWQYPQFLANEKGQNERLIRHEATYGLPADSMK